MSRRSAGTCEVGSTDSAHYRRWIEERVRFNDADMQGHVNNAVIQTYFEVGRIGLQEECPPEPGLGLVLAQISIQYLAPIPWPALVRIGTRVAAVSERSCTMQQALFLGPRCMAVCGAVVVSIELASGKAVAHGQRRRTYLESLHRSEAAL
jgi:acyl-CoA thioester hydrolase